MAKLNATEKKILRTMKPGVYDSQASLSELTSIRLGIIGLNLRRLVRLGCVTLEEKGYTLTHKGRIVSDCLRALRQSRRP